MLELLKYYALSLLLSYVWTEENKVERKLEEQK